MAEVIYCRIKDAKQYKKIVSECTIGYDVCRGDLEVFSYLKLYLVRYADGKLDVHSHTCGATQKPLSEVMGKKSLFKKFIKFLIG